MSDTASTTRVFPGIGVSPGTAVGPALIFLPASPNTGRRTIPPDYVIQEQAALRQALQRAHTDLEAFARQVTRTVGAQTAAIFTAQALMLRDPDIHDRALTLIATDHLDAVTAVTMAGEAQAALLAQLEDTTLRARAADVRDVVLRVVTILQMTPSGGDLAKLLAEATTPPVIVARDLAPSATAQLRADQVAGICLEQGGQTSHAAILARALGIPAIVGIGPLLLDALAPGDEIGLDVVAGTVYLFPDAPTRDHLRQAQVQQQQARRARSTADVGERARPGATGDGWRVVLAANIGSIAEALAARDWGAEAIGLLRTEFLFADRTVMPTEEEQAEIYAQIFAAFTSSRNPSAPIVVRTLDAGADKPMPALRTLTQAEENPALGFRGLRISLAFPDLLQAQIGGMVRAAGLTKTPLHIMFPMVATLDELRLALHVVQQVQATFAGQQVPLPPEQRVGIMVETPAATVTADLLAREADFLSIGTNDLTQYVMATDRLNPRVAHLYHPLQPAVLRCIAHIVQAGRVAGRPVAVCGEMAGDPVMGAVLVGLGVTELSMAAPQIPLVKAALARVRYPTLRAWADRILELATLAEVQNVLADGIPQH